MCTHELTTFLDPGCEQKFGDKRDAVVCAGQMAADFIESNGKYFLQSLILKRVRNRKNIAGQCLILRRRCRSRRFREQWTAPGQNLWKQHPALEEKYGLALDTEINKFSTSPEPGLKKPCSYTLGMKVTNPPTSSGTPLHIIKKSKPYGRTTCISKPTFHRPKTYKDKSENICPDIEFIVMFEKRDKPAAINVSIDGKSKDKRTIFADEQAPFRKKPFLPKT